MNEEPGMRSRNVLRNTCFSLALEVLMLAFGLIMPRWIILTYGSNVNGLTSTINQIIGVINLLQAGAVGASIFEMYKPVAAGNYKAISMIYTSSKRYFNRLGCVFFLSILAVIPYVVWSQSRSGLPPWTIAASMLILGINAGYNFFFYACYDIIFSAHQMNYQMSLAGIIEKLVYYGLLFIIVGAKIHFIFMYMAVLLGGTSKILYLAYAFHKSYQKMLVPVEKHNFYKVKNKGHLLANQIATQVIESSPVLMISGTLGLRYASVYAVYNLIQQTLRTVFSTIQYSIAASFGNVTVSENQEKVNRIFNIIHFVFCMMGVFLYTCTAFLFMPFVHLYTKNFDDVNYIQPLLAIYIVLYAISWCLYMPYLMASNAYGLFRETSKQSVLCAAISLLLSVIGVKMNICLALSGVLFYYLASFLWRLHVMRKHIPWFSLNALARRTIILIVLPMFAYLLYRLLGLTFQSWLAWIMTAGVTTAAVCGILLMYILAFERSEFQLCLHYARSLIRGKKQAL